MFTIPIRVISEGCFYCILIFLLVSPRQGFRRLRHIPQILACALTTVYFWSMGIARVGHGFRINPRLMVYGPHQ
jgi:hypothetical protein